MSSYFPQDRDILTSSMWAEPPPTFKVWCYLMWTANVRTGIVTDTIPAIAIRCALDLGVVQAALTRFSEPDPFSRTKRKDGRRIEFCPEGIRLINYKRKRDKDYSTPRVQRFRKKRRETVKRVPSVTGTTDTDTDTDTKGCGGEAPKPPAPPPAPIVDLSLWEAFQAAKGRGTAAQFGREVESCLAAGVTKEAILTFIATHPGLDVFDLGKGLIPRVKPGRGNGQKQGPPPPTPRRDCPECHGTGMRDGTVTLRDGSVSAVVELCPCRDVAPAPQAKTEAS